MSNSERPPLHRLQENAVGQQREIEESTSSQPPSEAPRESELDGVTLALHALDISEEEVVVVVGDVAGGVSDRELNQYLERGRMRPIRRIGTNVFLAERTTRPEENENEQEGDGEGEEIPNSAQSVVPVGELVQTLKELYSQRLAEELQFAKNDLANLEQAIRSFVLHSGLRVTFQHSQLRDTLQTHPLFPDSFFFASETRLMRYDVRERQLREIASIESSRIRYFKISPSCRFLLFGSGNGCYIVEGWRKMEFDQDGQEEQGVRVRCGVLRSGWSPNYVVFERQSETSLYVAAQSRKLRRYNVENSTVPYRERRRTRIVKVFGRQLEGLKADYIGPCLSFNLTKKIDVGSYANCVCESNPTTFRGLPHYFATATDMRGFQLLTDDSTECVFSEGGHECDYVEFSGNGRYFACAGDCELRVFEVCDCDSLPFGEVFSSRAKGTLSICKFHPTRHEILCWVEFSKTSTANERVYYAFCVANIAKRQLVFRLFMPFRVAGFDFESTRGECVYLGLKESPYVVQLDFARSFLLGTEMQDRLLELQKRQALCDVVIECEWM